MSVENFEIFWHIPGDLEGHPYVQERFQKALIFYLYLRPCRTGSEG